MAVSFQPVIPTLQLVSLLHELSSGCTWHELLLQHQWLSTPTQAPLTMWIQPSSHRTIDRISFPTAIWRNPLRQVLVWVVWYTLFVSVSNYDRSLIVFWLILFRAYYMIVDYHANWTMYRIHRLLRYWLIKTRLLLWRGAIALLPIRCFILKWTGL